MRALPTSSQINTSWRKVLHDEDMAAAILDRVLERGRFIHLDGPPGQRDWRPSKPPRQDHEWDVACGSPSRVRARAPSRFCLWPILRRFPPRKNGTASAKVAARSARPDAGNLRKSATG